MNVCAEFTREQLERFAAAGGWRRGADGLWLNPFDNENDPLPDFTKHMWSTLAVLEWFCEKPVIRYWVLKKETWEGRPERNRFKVEIAALKSCWPRFGLGVTKQEAIINAVLHALEEES